MNIKSINQSMPSFGAKLVKNQLVDELMRNMDNKELKEFKSKLKRLDKIGGNDVIELKHYDDIGDADENDKVLLNYKDIDVKEPTFFSSLTNSIKGVGKGIKSLFVSDSEDYRIVNSKNEDVNVQLHQCGLFTTFTEDFLSALDRITWSDEITRGRDCKDLFESPKLKTKEVQEKPVVKEVVKKQEKDFTQDLEGLKLLENVDKKFLSKTFNKLNIKDIEYVENKETTNIYLKGGAFSYDMTLGKAADGSLSGIVSKEFNDGRSELYMTRIEFIETNKSNRAKISFMQVVQNGVEDNSEVQQKNVKELSGEIVSKEKVRDEVTAWKKTASSYGEGLVVGGLPIPGLGILGMGYKESEAYSPAAMSHDTINKINVNMLQSNSDVRKTTTFAMNKTNGTLTQTGSDIGLYSSATKKHADWDFVKGPHGNVFEVPKFVNISENGIKGDLIIDIMHHNANQTLKTTFTADDSRYNGNGVIHKNNFKLPEYVKSEEELSKSLEMLMKFRNGTPIPTIGVNDSFTHYGRINNYEEVDQLIEVVREMLKAEKAYNEGNTTEEA